jgi:hypothetical protein
MPLDTSIIRQATFQPIQFKSPDRVNMLLQAAQAANQLQELQAAPQRRAQYEAQVRAQQQEVDRKVAQQSLQQYLGALGRTQNAQQARGVIALGFKDPGLASILGRFTTPDQEMAGVPDDPAQFNDWLRTQVLAPAERFKERTQGSMSAQEVLANMPEEQFKLLAQRQGELAQSQRTDRAPAEQRLTADQIFANMSDEEFERLVQRRSRIATATRAPAAATTAPAGGRPLSEADINKRRDAVAKEYRNAGTALQSLADTLGSAEQVRIAPGLERATGFTGAYLPSFPGGSAAQAQTRLDNLKGKITAMGKATAAMSGAIGSIANQEWKILADQIAVIDPVKGARPMLEQIASLEQQARVSMERIKDAYEKQFGEDFERFPQFRDLPMPARGGGINVQRDAAPRPAATTNRPPAQGNLTQAEKAELDALRRRFGRQQ